MGKWSLCSTELIQKGQSGSCQNRHSCTLVLLFWFPSFFLAESRFFNNSFFFFFFLLFFSHNHGVSVFFCCFLTNRGSSKPKTEHKERPFKQLKTLPEERQSWIPSPFIHCTFFIKRRHKKKKVTEGGEVWWKERGSNLKHSESGSVLDVVLFADMLDNKDPKRLLCVPIPFCYHCVTASLSVVLVIFFPHFSVLVSSFAPSFLRLVLLTDTGPSPGCLLCVLVTYCGDIFYI